MFNAIVIGVMVTTIVFLALRSKGSRGDGSSDTSTSTDTCVSDSSGDCGDGGRDGGE